jgi:hypothetical protein
MSAMSWNFAEEIACGSFPSSRKCLPATIRKSRDRTPISHLPLLTSCLFLLATHDQHLRASSAPRAASCIRVADQGRRPDQRLIAALVAESIPPAIGQTPTAERLSPSKPQVKDG